MKKIMILFLLSITSYAHAEFTVAMYNDFKKKSNSPDQYISQSARNAIGAYLTGVALGADEISQFESIKNKTPFPYCLPKGTRIGSNFAQYVVDSVLSDKDIKLENIDSMEISRVYVIGVLRYYRCQ